MPDTIRHGDVLAGRYRLEDLLTESGEGRFWRAHDRVLARPVAVHVMASDDPRAPALLEAARRSATVSDPHLLRVLDAERREGFCYVVNEWGTGTSLDILLAAEGPLAPRRAAWIVSEVADALATGHAAGVAHGRLTPENVLIDTSGSIRVIGYAVEAALCGLPPGRRGTDIVDLVGVLYAGLTGRWAGASTSEVPAAPEEGGRVLRPRQVRAGVPRSLDHLCDEVLNSRGAGGSVQREAAEIADLLRELVGDPTALIAAEAAREHGVQRPPLLAGPFASLAPREPETAPTDVSPTLQVPLVEPDPAPDPAPEVAPDAAPETESDAGPVPPPAVPPPVVPPPVVPPTDVEPTDVEPTDVEPTVVEPKVAPVEQPTQAGLPIFDDEADDVSWLAARAETPPPPPPFEDPPVRPLFAPDPPDGEPVRRPRPGAAPTSGSGDFWPWGAEVNTGTGTGTSTGHTIPPYVEETEPESLPGRRSLLAAALVGLGALLLVVVVIAWSLGKGTPSFIPFDNDDDPTPSATPSAAPPTPIKGITATELDPDGDGAESPERVPLALDGDPSTTWITKTYKDQFAVGGYRSGVGLVLDLQDSREVRDIKVELVGSPTTLEAYLTDEAPQSVADLKPVASGTADGASLSLRPAEGATGRYLTLWLTGIPPVGVEFRGEIADVVVRE
ncbi:protein kinase family protein [Nocardioides pacificus]